MVGGYGKKEAIYLFQFRDIKVAEHLPQYHKVNGRESTVNRALDGSTYLN
jgi:hypothetical protein